MSTFDQAFAFTVAIETDQLTDDSSDSGGATKFGISQVNNQDVDVASLTEETAKAIYRKRYWDPIRGDELLPALACMTFDTAVNQGVSRGTLILQRTLGVNADGVIGPATIAAALRVDIAQTIAEFSVNRFMAYAAIPQFTRYGHGWSRRVIKCHDFAKSIHKGDA